MESLFNMSDSLGHIWESTYQEQNNEAKILNTEKEIEMNTNNQCLAYLNSRSMRYRRKSIEGLQKDDTDSINPSLHRIGGLFLFIMLRKLSFYSRKSSDEKNDSILEMFSKTDIIFKMVEKILFFEQASKNFRKYKYFEIFNLSNGRMYPSNSWTKHSATLFSPELNLYMQNL